MWGVGVGGMSRRRRCACCTLTDFDRIRANMAVTLDPALNVS